MQELDLLSEDANVFELIGPVLVSGFGRGRVRKRIEYTSAELYVSVPVLFFICYFLLVCSQLLQSLNQFSLSL